ncbi:MULTISPECIES: DNA recombination protein RmuC [unclassified Rhizobacter]|uniref:DNA recombination protein RmuC n=1 Tax=unclassified Rhizobacter TaxID=2640088 RepID=UPI0006FA2D84|nr:MULTISPECIES: DNA recombination protein RmuC [unclassified Rhizobacter]KQU81665.1 recombinase RmuC [Rhizobacter sp. Root29]KQW01648.1 recombinase RmuC [Rhizobacter sp. Root1238]KRB18526.1 recombinase RmuC [Rhizobacter sp. Root16D2]
MLLDWISLALLVLVLLLLLWLALRRPDQGSDHFERLERGLRDDVARSAQGTRQELGQTLASFQQTLLAQQGDVARTQNEQIDSFRTQLAATQQAQEATLARLAEQQANALKRFADALGDQLRSLSQSNDQRLTEMRGAVEQKLSAIQADNEKKLEQMRATVDEKLHATLEQRLGESFKLVADRLDQVHKGLGEMQNLARDVGSLNRVLTNVKTRGIFGEVQLAGLLEQVFTPEQYAVNVETVPGSGARVEFAIRLPGQRVDGVPLWLPVDAKFPREDYERLLDAQDRADPGAVEVAAKAIETRLRLEARSIHDKYVSPPHTTDFAILFVPTEGLYAEALRRPGLVESLQREHHVMLAGPTTLLATLNSLQMGFRTLALEKRSVEVWEVLGAVKTEFAKFGDVLAKTKKKLDEASNTIDQAQTRANVMARKLKSVEAVTEAHAQALLPLALPRDDDAIVPDLPESDA